MASLFISYSRKDIETARKLTKAFDGQGLDFWIDWEGIPPTVDWWKEIEKGIEEADIFLFLLSPDSATSPVCRREIEHAVKNGKRLIPVVNRDVKADESPQELQHLNWIFLRETDDFDPAFSKLITAVKTDYGWVQAHKQLQVKALEWERSNAETSFLLRGKELQDAELQLVANASKEPHPTDLQREYVLRSRHESDQQRRRTRGISIAVIIALAVLAIFGFVQARLATANAAKEQVASTLAFNNAETAQVNALEAQQQERIARIRELSAQAELNLSSSPSRALLLAIEAARLNQQANLPLTVSVRQALYDTLKEVEGDPLPGSEDTVDALQLSKDGKWLFTDSDFNVQVWRMAQPWSPPLMIEHANLIKTTTAGRVVLGLDTNLEIWDFSGEEPKRLLQFTFDQGYRQTLSNQNFYVDPEGYSSKHFAISGDGRWFVIQKEDKTLGVFDLDAPQKKAAEFSSPYRAEDEPGFRFSPKGDWLVIRQILGESYLYRMELDDTNSLMDIRQQEHLPPAVFENFGMENFSFSPDGNWLLVSGTQVELWDIHAGDISAQTVISETLLPYSFSPDSQYLVDGNGAQARLWRLNAGLFASNPAPPLTGPPVSWRVDFSSDGRFALVVGNDGVLYSWNLASGAIHGPANAGAFAQEALFLPDGSGAVVRTIDGELFSFSLDLTTRRKLGSVPDVFGFNMSIAGQFVILQDTAGKVYVFDSVAPTPGTSERYVTARSYSDFVVSGDGRWLIAGSSSDLVPRLWDLNDLHGELAENIVQIFPGGQDAETIDQALMQKPSASFALSRDGRWLANVSDSNGQLFDLSGTVTVPIVLDSSVGSLAFSPDSQWLAIYAGPSRTIDIWSLGGDRPAPSSSFDLPPGKWALAQVEFSPDGKWLVANDGWQAFALNWERRDSSNWRALSPTPPESYGGGGGRESGFRPGHNQAISPDGRWLAFGRNLTGLSEDGSFDRARRFVWDLTDLSKNPLELLAFPYTNNMLFSADGRWLAVVPEQGGIAVLWDMNAPDPPATFLELIGNRRLVSAVAFSSDNHWLATGHGSEVYLWDLTAENPSVSPRILQGHTDIIWSMVFSPDGQTLASGSRDQTIRLWDMRAQNITTSAVILYGHIAEVYDLLFPDNYLLVSNSYDGTTRFWDLNFGEMLARACGKAGRNFTVQESELYFNEATPHEICLEWSSSAASATIVEVNGIHPTVIATLSPTSLPIDPPTLMNPTLDVSATPTAQASIQYVVQSGDSLTSIAGKFNVPMEWIIQDNNIGDPNAIRVGQVLIIRVNATATPGSSATP